MKNSNGFTLIEAIITAAIVAILAAVAIPLYTGYVQSSRQDTVNNLAQTAAAAGNVYFRKTGTDPTLAQLNLYYDPGQFDIMVNAPNITVTNHQYTTITKTLPYR